jgi:hypothetical protein
MEENGRTVVSCERKNRKNGGFLPTAPCPRRNDKLLQK